MPANHTPNEAIRAAIAEAYLRFLDEKIVPRALANEPAPTLHEAGLMIADFVLSLPSVEPPSAPVPVSREMMVMADSLLSWAQSGKRFDAQQDRDAGRVIAALRGTYDSQKERRFVGAKIDELAQILADRFVRNGNVNISAQDQITAQRFVFSLLEGGRNG